MKRVFVCTNHTVDIAKRLYDIFSEEYLYSLRALAERKPASSPTFKWLKSFPSFMGTVLFEGFFFFYLLKRVIAVGYERDMAASVNCISKDGAYVRHKSTGAFTSARLGLI